MTAAAQLTVDAPAERPATDAEIAIYCAAADLLTVARDADQLAQMAIRYAQARADGADSAEHLAYSAARFGDKLNTAQISARSARADAQLGDALAQLAARARAQSSG